MGESKRWTVTYTRHMRQKRKVYQDGVLELRSTSNKVFLYDDSEKLLDSKFLKKDELVNCGGTLAFEAYLVDVGELERNFKPQTDLNSSCSDKKSDDLAWKYRQNATHISSLESKKNKKQCSSMRHYPSANRKSESANCGSKDSCRNATGTILREWDALYTTQITQKAKRYHDGIIRLMTCGSHINQVILLNEDGDTLSSKYVKSIECVKSGSKYDLPNYLIEICEPRSIQEDVKKSSLEEVVITEKPKDSKMTDGRTVLREEPFRDACEILSILKQPLPGERLVTRQLPVEQTHHSQSSVLLRPDLWGGSSILKAQVPETKFSKNFMEDRNEKDCENLSSQSATQVHNDEKARSKFQACEKVSSAISNAIDQRMSQPESSSATNLSSRTEEYKTPATEEVKSADSINPEATNIIRKPEVSRTSICNSANPNQLDITSQINASGNANDGDGASGADPSDGINEDVHFLFSLVGVSSEEKERTPSTLLKGQISSDQSNSCIKEIPSRVKDENSNQIKCSGLLTVILCAESIKAEENICDKNTMTRDEFPTFDLGI